MSDDTEPTFPKSDSSLRTCDGIALLHQKSKINHHHSAIHRHARHNPASSESMITSLKIENFKSFGHRMEPLHLRPLNFIVGANASGKTNFISALRFLKTALLQNVEVASAEHGGTAEIRNKILREREKPKPFRIEFTIKPTSSIRFRSRVSEKNFNPGEIRFVTEIDMKATDGIPIVLKESLEVDLFIENKHVDTFSLQRSRDEVEVHDPSGLRQIAQAFRISEEDRSRLVSGSGFFSGYVSYFRRQIEGWSFYNINPDVARLASKDTVEPELGPSGEALASILHRLEKSDRNRRSLDHIVAGLQGAVPGFKGIKTLSPDFEGKRSFQILEDRIRTGINPRSVSDGTIRLLSLLVIAHWSARKSTLLAVEEPENGLHPHLARNIIEILRTASEHKQVLVTTHNPDFLDELAPEEVLLCDKVDGITQVHHASDIENIAAFQKHFRIGELWEQGTLGGVP
jgi:predicted ATPase